jgi:hypothetical protein
MDTTKTHNVIVINTSKDTTKSQNIKSNSYEKYTIDTVIIKKDTNCDWVNPVKDFATNLIWPLITLIIILVFKEQIKKLISHIKEFSAGKDGVKIIIGEEKPGEFITNKAGFMDSTKILLEDKMINKILSTFWKNQQKITDAKVRWSFSLSSSNNEFGDFISSMKKLIDKGFVKQDILSQQFYLTIDGVELCKQHEKELTSEVFKL